MGIEIDIPSYLRSFASEREAIEVNGGTIGECLDELVKKFPDIKKMLFPEDDILHSYVTIFLNGTDAYPDELAKPVKDGDHLQILYIIGGG